eukprot:CAMPEP_0174344024 /NCGR_PEP_ID=MMETSP0810-20121108/27408_1 /TAXON_ID=73025 ORGANISM="Eutreptiella gymnastica-like, Strain CCMP1594" /NCGR_SAMPLE_ID=MMETSP0810 /ASSEMBLY_ACC=CAM_ASM_000659 /LENGTH=416 /DNA_ID=CAMNT_0015467067 /DNA_START=29 /DNA_END=1281 /DNA_ORIENTATION=-
MASNPAVAWLRTHKVPHLFNELIKELLLTKPGEPYGFLESVLGNRKGGANSEKHGANSEKDGANSEKNKEEAAATKIQALKRGRDDRAKVEEMKKENMPLVPISEHVLCRGYLSFSKPEEPKKPKEPSVKAEMPSVKVAKHVMDYGYLSWTEPEVPIARHIVKNGYLALVEPEVPIARHIVRNGYLSLTVCGNARRPPSSINGAGSAQHNTPNPTEQWRLSHPPPPPPPCLRGWPARRQSVPMDGAARGAPTPSRALLHRRKALCATPLPFMSCTTNLCREQQTHGSSHATGPAGAAWETALTLRHVSDSRAALGPHVGGSGVDLPLGGIPNSSGGARRNPNGPAIECSLNFLPRFSWVAIAVRAVAGGVCRWWGLRFAPSGSEDSAHPQCSRRNGSSPHCPPPMPVPSTRASPLL